MIPKEISQMMKVGTLTRQRMYSMLSNSLAPCLRLGAALGTATKVTNASRKDGRWGEEGCDERSFEGSASAQD